MSPELKAKVKAHQEEAFARADRNVQKIDIDLAGVKLDHQKHRLVALAVYHLKAKASARAVLAELECCSP